MKRLPFVLVLWLIVVPPALPEQREEDLSDAEKLTFIHSPAFRERETTQRRFTFLLNEFDEYCGTEPGGAVPSDMLVFSHEKLKEAGLDGDESLLGLANTLYRMTVDIASSATRAGSEAPKCSEIWTMYLV